MSEIDRYRSILRINRIRWDDFYKRIHLEVENNIFYAVTGWYMNRPTMAVTTDHCFVSMRKVIAAPFTGARIEFTPLYPPKGIVAGKYFPMVYLSSLGYVIKDEDTPDQEG
jgi:hypothetical protein